MSNRVVRNVLPAVAVAALVSAMGVACFDPLFEDPAFARAWVVCCRDGFVGTCACNEAAGCQPQLRPCASGTCVTPASAACPGDGTDSGTPGPGDAGTVGDAGQLPGDGGPDTDGGTDAGTPPPDTYVLCCEGGWVTTCRCTEEPCADEPFTACSAGTCAESGQSCR